MTRTLQQQDRNELRKMIEASAENAERKITAKDPGWEQDVTALSRKFAIGKLQIEKDLTALDKVQKQFRLSSFT